MAPRRNTPYPTTASEGTIYYQHSYTILHVLPPEVHKAVTSLHQATTSVNFEGGEKLTNAARVAMEEHCPAARFNM